MTTEPRGIRNNNPGNIRWSESINWKGQAGKDQSRRDDKLQGRL